MKKTVLSLVVLVLGALASAQQPGTRMPSEVPLEDFSQTRAESFDDFLGRAVLLEFFAYW